MGFWEYLLIGGAVAALVFGYLHLPRLVAYLVFLVIAVWPTYTLGAEHSWSVATMIVLVLVIFAVYALLYWIGSKVGRRTTAS